MKMEYIEEAVAVLKQHNMASFIVCETDYFRIQAFSARATISQAVSYLVFENAQVNVLLISVEGVIQELDEFELSHPQV